MAEPAIQSINQHTQKTSLDWLFNILVQPSTGAGSGVAPATHEQFGMSLDLLRQALVEVTNVVNNVTTTVPGKVLDARQGKVLADSIAAILAQKAAANGIATLGADGLVPSTQLPSYVDDVLEYDSFSLLPETGETSKIYVTLDTNLTYRWSGSGYTEISESLALGETEATAYRGDRGKTAYDHTLLADNPHSVTKEQVGLGNVDNTSDADKPVSTAQQAELDLKIPLTQKGQASGVATLGADGKIPSDQIPAIALVDVFPVESEAAMLALDAEQGDMAIRTDSNQVFILSASPASTLENWIELSALKALVDAAIADLAGAGRTTETVKANADDIISIKGTGYTEGSLKTHEDRLDTLEADDTTEGSVAKTVKDAVEPIDARLTGLDTLTYEGITYRVSRKIENGHLVTTYTEVA